MRAKKVGPVRDRDWAAAQLAFYTRLPADAIDDPTMIDAAFVEATSVHPFNDGCEHCLRCRQARDILLDVTPAPAGQGSLL